MYAVEVQEDLRSAPKKGVPPRSLDRHVDRVEGELCPRIFVQVVTSGLLSLLYR